jgi:hypothetical protein
MTVVPLEDDTEKGKYLVVASKTPELDIDTGDTFVYCKVLNICAKEMKSAEARYIIYKTEKETNHEDPTYMKEMKVSEQIDKDIHILWKTLNPSDLIK